MRWRNAEAWTIGRMRAAYKAFYDDTPIGRAYALAPRNERFDELHYWYDVEEEPKVPPHELAKQVSELATRVVSLQGFVTVTAFVAGILVLIRWIWSR